MLKEKRCFIRVWS